MSVCRIVIVEDNVADVLLVGEALKQAGVECTLERFSNGEDAAKAIAEMSDAPSAFVVDLNLPRVHGLELLRLIRACPAVSGVPVAILTSSRSPHDRTKSEQLGANAYIIKPSGFNEFMETVGPAIAGLLRPRAGEATVHLAYRRRCAIRVSQSRARRLHRMPRNYAFAQRVAPVNLVAGRNVERLKIAAAESDS